MTHKTELLAWFRRGLSITPAEAVDRFRNYRLADTVYTLRKEGHDVRTETMETVNADGRKVRFARYHYLCGPKGEETGTVPSLHNSGAPQRQDNRMSGLWPALRNWLK